MPHACNVARCVSISSAIATFNKNFMMFPNKIKTLRKLLNLIAGLMVVSGMVGSFGLSMSKNWIPSTFELPVDNAENVLVTSNNTYIVALSDRNKIQIYNNNKELINGWYVNTNGSPFKVLPVSDNIFKVVAIGIGGEFFLYYDITGKQLSSDEAYSISKNQDRARIEDTVYIPTPFYLLSFTDFARSFIVAFVGIILLLINGEFKLGFLIFLKDFKKSYKGEKILGNNRDNTK